MVSAECPPHLLFKRPGDAPILDLEALQFETAVEGILHLHLRALDVGNAIARKHPLKALKAETKCIKRRCLACRVKAAHRLDEGWWCCAAGPIVPIAGVCDHAAERAH